MADSGSPGTCMRAVRRLAVMLAILGPVVALAAPARSGAAPVRVRVADTSATPTVWLCRPGAAEDPCASSLKTTVVKASGATQEVSSNDDTSSPFDCFYVYPTVSKQKVTNADLEIQKPEIAAAVYEASRFSTVCRVWAPMYRQVTLSALAAHPDLDLPASLTNTAYASLQSAFEDYLENDNDGRPIIFIGHSQGAAMVILLLKHFVDDTPALRDRTVLAIILGGNVELKTGSEVGGTFSNIPICDSSGETGCVIAYSTFPSTPPAGSHFGRPGQGVSLQSGQRARTGLEVACVNPASLGGGTAPLDSYFPPTGGVLTPWVEYPDRYTAHCEHADGATWLEVQTAKGRGDHRPVVSEVNGPDWGYHPYDVNLALGDLLSDVASAEAMWSHVSHPG